MSQITTRTNGGVVPVTVVETLTGNTGGAVGPTGNNINVVGDGVTVSVAGNPGTSTLTITASATTPTSFTADVGTATPALNNLNVFGAHNINTTGAGSTITVQNDNTSTWGDLSVVTANNAAVTLQSGDLVIQGTGVGAGGNLNMPTTSSANIGVIEFGGIPYIHQYSTGEESNIFAGENAGNFTLIGGSNSGFGGGALALLTSGSRNTAVGANAGIRITTGDNNTAIGQGSMSAGVSALTGDRNSSLGSNTLANLTSGSVNCAVGSEALYSCTTGNSNIGIGSSNASFSGGALRQLVSGTSNIAIGSTTASNNGAGYNYTGSESSNICLGGATLGTTGESNTMRLGTSGSGDGQVNRAFVAGTYGITPAGATQTMVMDSNGQMGTVASAPVVGAWTVVTGATQALAINNGYIANAGGGVTFTLPGTAAVGSIIRVTGINAGGWIIAQNAGQAIRLGSVVSTTGVGGSLASTANGDTVELVCTVANTDFIVLSMIGNITVV